MNSPRIMKNVSTIATVYLLTGRTCVHSFALQVRVPSLTPSYSHSPLAAGDTTTRRYSSFASSSTSWQHITQEECEDFLATSIEAARAAGAIILSNLGCCSETDEACEIKYSIKDVVTEYDQQAQATIQNMIQNKYPKHSFLGEEDVGAGGAASAAALESALASSPSDYLWICDPIDGTANFASGLPLCGVTITVLYQTVPLVGLIYDPHRDELFSAIRGRGAQLNGEPMCVQAAVSQASDAIVNAGCPADPNAFEVSMRGMLAMNARARGVRVLACSALSLAWIASGRLTAHFGYDLSSWDLVAGALLIQEAGGRITDITGEGYRVETRNMLCSNGQVHDEILEILKEADATSFERA